MMKKTVFFLLTLCCLSCHTDKNKGDNQILLHSILYLNDEYIGRGGAIIAYKGGIVGIEEAGSLAPFFNIDIQGENHILTHFGNRGQGPEDFIRPYPIQYINEDVFGAYDITSKTYKEITIPKGSVGESAHITSHVTFESRPFQVIKTAYGQYAGLSANEGLIILIDSVGEKHAAFFEYPYRDKDEQDIENNLRAMAYQGIFAANPSKTKCVYASLNGEIIHFYDMQKDNISLIRKIENIYPSYKKENDIIVTNVKNRVGYISLSATDQFIYALYCGKTLEELKGENGFSLESTQVRVFDWTGEMVETYALDVPCRYISVSNDGKKLWAIALNPDIVPVCFDLSNQVKNNNQMPVSGTFNHTNLIEDEESEKNEKPTNKINIGKIKIGEIKEYNLSLQSLPLSLTTTSQDVFVKSSTLLDGQRAIYVRITKQHPGVFNDTVMITTESNKGAVIFSGEAIEKTMVP
ncbi:MAG: TolB-like 6-bladed beta-propeller domain-containing protein [Tannerellaceae bacterium]|jgi:hypothetical protein|nr:TolB-like 6-bladed beta-propeller domain-containing protein [Tannerellaceae bacterium]